MAMVLHRFQQFALVLVASVAYGCVDDKSPRHQATVEEVVRDVVTEPPEPAGPKESGRETQILTLDAEKIGAIVVDHARGINRVYLVLGTFKQRDMQSHPERRNEWRRGSLQVAIDGAPDTIVECYFDANTHYEFLRSLEAGQMVRLYGKLVRVRGSTLTLYGCYPKVDE